MSVVVHYDIWTKYGELTSAACSVFKHFKGSNPLTPSVVGYAETDRFYAEISIPPRGAESQKEKGVTIISKCEEKFQSKLCFSCEEVQEYLNSL